MRKIRQYNDTAVQWSLLVKGTGEPFTLEGKTIRLFLKSLFATTEIEDFTIAGNTIGWVYKGEKQEHTGVYTLVVSVVDAQGVMVTTDTCDFVEIVDCTCKVGGNDPAGVKTETIELTSVVEVGAVSADLSTYLTKIEAANTYQRQEQGKGLSTNDYTDAEKARLNTLEQDVQQLKEQGVADLSDYLTKDEFNERIEGYATHDSVQELSENVTELSAEVGKKQDTITDLATIRSGAAKGATAIQEVKTINGQSIVGSGNIEIQGGGGGASTDKQGVVSQTLTYNSADNTYSVSNVVRGSIPSFFIDLVTEAGASFNAESGYFSLNGIDNIAYDEMRQIYDCRTGYGTNSLLAVYGATYTARTNFVAFRGYVNSFVNHEPTTIYTKYLCGNNASITKFSLCSESPLYVRTGSGNNFESFGLGANVVYRSRLEEIIGVLNVENLTGSNNFFYNGAWHPWLTTFQLKGLKASIDLSGMPRLSEATILYMINNEKATSAITIKLHADAKTMADASEAIQSALANHANITLGV